MPGFVNDEAKRRIKIAKYLSLHVEMLGLTARQIRKEAGVDLSRMRGRTCPQAPMLYALGAYIEEKSREVANPARAPARASCANREGGRSS